MTQPVRHCWEPRSIKQQRSRVLARSYGPRHALRGARRGLCQGSVLVGVQRNSTKCRAGNPSNGSSRKLGLKLAELPRIDSRYGTYDNPAVIYRNTDSVTVDSAGRVVLNAIDSTSGADRWCGCYWVHAQYRLSITVFMERHEPGWFHASYSLQDGIAHFITI
jgi:hypothetical protein